MIGQRGSVSVETLLLIGGEEKDLTSLRAKYLTHSDAVRLLKQARDGSCLHAMGSPQARATKEPSWSGAHFWWAVAGMKQNAF